MRTYYKKICEDMEQVKEWPTNPDSILTMACLIYIKEHCEKHHESWEPKANEDVNDDDHTEHAHHFTRQMAMEWTAGMVNADGTRGPHWTMEETEKLRKQHSLDCDPAEFWVVLNSLYSDYCEALRESGISTPEVYIRLAKAWIWDKDAVPDKAAAYYTYVVAH